MILNKVTMHLSFYFTNASLALFANGINWVDGLLSTIIMAILSILICFFVVLFCRDMLVNDDEEKDELRVSRIKCWTPQDGMSLILYDD